MEDGFCILIDTLEAMGSDEAPLLLKDHPKVAICTVRDDVHDIGKSIVKLMLEVAGFDVLDLGVDVPPARIVERVKNAGIHFVALSGVLSLASDSMRDTVDAFTRAGLRDSVKIIIGGALVTEELVGADAWARSPKTTVSVCTKWALENSSTD